jgi:hypothetical protein
MIPRVVSALALLFSNGMAIAQDTKTATVPSPLFELSTGERYFRLDGVSAFVLGRNPIAISGRK